MSRTFSWIIALALAAGTLGAGCSSYHRFRPTAVELAGIPERARRSGDMSDATVVAYADQTRDILRKRFHIARNARQTSATAQILLAGAAGLAAAFDGGATMIATLAAGSAGVPQIAEVFDTGNRAMAYQQAVAKISEAEDAYFRVRAGSRPVVPSQTLTTEGALLLEAINGATDAVELFQAGMLPTLDQLRRAEATELRRRAAAKDGSMASGGNRSGSTFVRDDFSGVATSRTVKPPALEKRREKLIARVRNLTAPNAAGEILQDLHRTPPPNDAEARDQLVSIIANATDPLLEGTEDMVESVDPGLGAATTQKQREGLVQSAKKLRSGQATAVLGGLGENAPADDKQARTRLKVLISVSDDAALTRIETLLRNPPEPATPAVPATPKPIEPTTPAPHPANLSAAEKQQLQERLVQDIKALSLRGANEVLLGVAQPVQTERAPALTKLKVAISNADDATLLKLDRLIKNAPRSP